MALLAVSSENTAIAAIFVPSTTYYLALFTTSPGQTGTSGEITNTGGSTYAVSYTHLTLPTNREV